MISIEFLINIASYSDAYYTLFLYHQRLIFWITFSFSFRKNQFRFHLSAPRILLLSIITMLTKTSYHITRQIYKTQIERFMFKKIKDNLHNPLIMCILVAINQIKNASPFGCTRLSFMATKITKIGITNNKISGRGGLPLFLRYVQEAGFYGLITDIFISLISKSKKGLQLQQFVKQMLAFFMDGIDMAIPTYKRKKGFQPLHICYGPFLIDVMFRKGSVHSNHGTDYIDRVSALIANRLPRGRACFLLGFTKLKVQE